MEEKLKEYYYDPKFGFLSNDKFYRRLKEDGVKVTRAQVNQFINRQLTAQITKPVRKQKVFNTIVSGGPGLNYQLDIIVYDRYEFNHYKYIMCVIDVYSRYASARAMTNRTMATIIQNIKSIFDEMGPPENLNCDNEFNTKEFNELMKEYKVRMWYSQPNEENKNSIVERFNRTISSMIQKWRQGTGSYDWAKVLPKLIENYNNSWHRTIKATPAQVWNNKIANSQKVIRLKHVFEDDELVRIKIPKGTFDKGDRLTYSKDLYRVSDVTGNKIWLEDEEGNVLERWYKPNELIHVEQVDEPRLSKDEEVHVKQKKTKKLNKDLKKEGIATHNIVEGTRQRVIIPPESKKPTAKKKKSQQTNVFNVLSIHDRKMLPAGDFSLVEWEGYPNKKDWTWERTSQIKHTPAFKDWNVNNG